MVQITTGFRSIFSHPSIYNLAQRLVGAEKARRILVNEFFPDMQGLRMLDIGCGTAEILNHLPVDMNYHGFDASDDYIAKATAQFGHRGTFKAELVKELTIEILEPFDLVLAVGLLHHLDDDEGHALFSISLEALKPGGTLITIDPTYASKQNPLARWIISKDRGQNIRTPDQYQRLAASYFSNITAAMRHNMLHMPYSHLILVCKK